MDYRALVAAPLAAVVVVSSAAEMRMPNGWITQTNATSYQMGVDPQAGLAHNSLTVKITAPAEARQFAAATQAVFGYAGQRVRFSAQVKAEGVDTWAGLSLGKGFVSIFRMNAGDADAQAFWPYGAKASANGSWQRLSVVMELPAGDDGVVDAGVLLVGKGQVWMRDVKLEVVGKDVALSTSHVGLDPADAQAKRRKQEAELASRALPPKNLALE